MTFVAVSGSGGFIGSALVASLEQRSVRVKRLDRSLLSAAARIDLARAIEGCDAVVHCAGLTPRRGQRFSDADFDLANHQLTRNVAVAVADANVPRLVFLSSIAAIGANAGVLTAAMPANPVGAYGKSKANAEAALQAMKGVHSLIVRPPLVYGLGAKGDLGLLVKLCATPLPLPFGAIDNRRSMVAITNLVDALCFLITANAAKDDPAIFHVSDAEPLSIRQIVSKIRAGMGRPPGLINVSPALLNRLLQAAGLSNVARKFLGDLVIDSSSLAEFGWRPPVGPDADLHRMARGFLRGRAADAG